MKVTVGIYTLGCRVNQYESEAIGELFEKLGASVIPASEVCDIYVINTCTVTAESDRKARQVIRRAVSRNPYAYVVVTGCLAQTSPDAVGEISGVDLIIGNTDKLSVAEKSLALFNAGGKRGVSEVAVENMDGAAFEEMSITKFDRSRVYVKIEDGCESRCTYCIIPAARGPVRSKPMAAVLSEIRALTENGCREVVLTGIETASYGRDLDGVGFIDLLEEIDKIENIGRVRLGSVDPSALTANFIERAAKIACLAPHIHLSVQSASDKILALMKRKYNSDMLRERIKLLREKIPGIKFTADIITGFPGEAEEDFRATYDFLAETRFIGAHIFPYSKRKGTPAAEMKNQVDEQVKKERLRTLSALVSEIRGEILKEKIAEGGTVSVLFESFEKGFAFGHTADYTEVSVGSSAPLHSQIKSVKLTGSDGNVCFGEITEQERKD